MNWGAVEFFKPEEFACRCCGVEKMQPDLVYALDKLRRDFGRPIRISSGYRCPKHNAAVSSTGSAGPHTTGSAADLAVSGRDCYVLLRLALIQRFTGIGVHQRGNSRFLHLDTLHDAPGQPRPWVWTY